MLKRTIIEDCLCYRLGWFISLRWLVILGLLPGVFVFAWLFRLEVNWIPFFASAVIMAIANFFFSYLYKNYVVGIDVNAPMPSFLRLFAHTQILFDLIVLSYLIYLLGTFRYPFYIFYIFHIIIASLLLEWWEVAIHATGASLLFSLTTVAEAFHPNTALSGVNYYPFVGVSIFHNFVMIFLPLVAGIYISMYMALSISLSLRRRREEISRLANELEEKNQALMRYSEVRERFMSVAFHDLKAPLAAADGYLNILIHDIGNKSEEEKKKMLERMYIRIQQLIGFLKDLHEYSNVELGTKEMELQDLDLLEIANEAVSVNEQLAKDKGLNYIAELQQAIYSIKGVKIRLLELFNNLISNAIKYTENGEVKITLVRNGDEAVFSVADTGRGIAKEEIPNLFKDFYRTADAKRSGIEGSGLGLAIVKKIADLYKGNVWVESEPGKGSTFYASLPLSK